MANDQYEDMLRLSRPISAGRKRMSMIDRAAQFSPFAALVGYDDVIEETARLTESHISLDESQQELLDRKQQYLIPFLPQMPEITVTYFLPDQQKAGGQYITITGQLKAILPHAKNLILADGTVLSTQDIIELDSPIFPTE